MIILVNDFGKNMYRSYIQSVVLRKVRKTGQGRKIGQFMVKKVIYLKLFIIPPW